MKHILAPEQRHVLARIAATPTLVALDFDGTLAPIVADPDAARMAASTQALLTTVAELYPCAVVSGRARHDVLHRLGAAPVQDVVGNHGLEHDGRARARDPRIDRWLLLLAPVLRPYEGVVMEDKGLSLSVHVRRASRKRDVVHAVRMAAEVLGDVRVVDGKEVVNLLPMGAPDKGTAVLALRSRHRCDLALYVGDDLTDEDAFAIGEDAGVIGVRVGDGQPSRARYCVRDQAEVDRLLEALAGHRREQPGAGAGR